MRSYTKKVVKHEQIKVIISYNIMFSFLLFIIYQDSKWKKTEKNFEMHKIEWQTIQKESSLYREMHLEMNDSVAFFSTFFILILTNICIYIHHHHHFLWNSLFAIHFQWIGWHIWEQIRREWEYATIICWCGDGNEEFIYQLSTIISFWHYSYFY
jgi:hypothetical protein